VAGGKAGAGGRQGAVRHCSLRYRMPCNPRNEGSRRVSVKGPGRYSLSRHKMPCHLRNNTLGDEASNVYLALPCGRLARGAAGRASRGRGRSQAPPGSRPHTHPTERFPISGRQGLTLVHFPAQIEPFLVTEATARHHFSAQPGTFLSPVSHHSPQKVLTSSR